MSPSQSPPTAQPTRAQPPVAGLLRSPAAALHVTVVECFGDPGHLPARPEELALLSPGAVPARRQQFTAGRWCAHEALRRIGRDESPLLARLDAPARLRRSVTWPTRTVGSITHCRGYQGAAVAHTRHAAGVGIDVEVNRPLPADALGIALRDSEIRSSATLARALPAVAWDRVVFTLREALFKAWSGIGDDWLDTSAFLVTPRPDGTATIGLDATAASAQGEFLGPITAVWRCTAIQGRPGLVGALVVLPAAAPVVLAAAA